MYFVYDIYKNFVNANNDTTAELNYETPSSSGITNSNLKIIGYTNQGVFDSMLKSIYFPFALPEKDQTYEMVIQKNSKHAINFINKEGSVVTTDTSSIDKVLNINYPSIGTETLSNLKWENSLTDRTVQDVLNLKMSYYKKYYSTGITNSRIVLFDKSAVNKIPTTTADTSAGLYELYDLLKQTGTGATLNPNHNNTVTYGFNSTLGKTILKSGKGMGFALYNNGTTPINLSTMAKMKVIANTTNNDVLQYKLVYKDTNFVEEASGWLNFNQVSTLAWSGTTNSVYVFINNTSSEDVEIEDIAVIHGA